jgi:hypothetical protein
MTDNLMTLVKALLEDADNTGHGCEQIDKALKLIEVGEGTPVESERVIDQNDEDAHYEDWLWCCRQKSNDASDGERVMSAKALQIAADVLHRVQMDTRWNSNDIKLALGAIAGIRGQRGCEGMESGCDYLTEVMDVAIYG